MSSNVSNGKNSANDDNQLTRLCHVIKRDDFDGYGFNLHAEKGKPGQYIGKVDDNSPAETSGLRQGDRIIEVNGVNIGTETHKQVVQRIKAIACEVRLLVVDPNVVPVTNDNVILASDENGHELNHNTLSNSVQTNGSSMEYASEDKREATPTPPPPPSAMALNASPLAASVDVRDNGATKLSHDNNGVELSNNSSQIIPKSPSKVATTTTSGEGLNLKMTAAELRAKLAAKKKYDPKSDTVDLRKKYEIVQKL